MMPVQHLTLKCESSRVIVEVTHPPTLLQHPAEPQPRGSIRGKYGMNFATTIRRLHAALDVPDPIRSLNGDTIALHRVYDY